MNVLFATSEAVPFAKSGGLADVAGALSKAVRNRGHACRVVMPLYDTIPEELREGMKFITYFNTPLAWRNQYCGIFEKTHGGVKYYFIDNEYYFKRGGLYGYYDDAERFAFFSRAVLEMLEVIDFSPDVIHCHDWQSALIPVYLDVFYRTAEKYRSIKTVFTIHNVQYQGNFDYRVSQDVLGLPEGANNILEFNWACNFMKGAVEQCDALTTVSPTYATELLDPWFAHGLAGLFAAKKYKLHGIVNGIDTKAYDPATDKGICKNFSIGTLGGKSENKSELQKLLGLNEDPDAMLIGMVSRLVSHKGLDLVEFAFERMMDMPVQLVVLGAGESQYEDFLRSEAGKRPGRVSVSLGYNEELSHKIYAGSDAFLMPSRSEPCGLSQMIAMRYGSLPIARMTGGLADTVRDFGGEDGNGYTFLTYNADDMLGAVGRAVGEFADKPLWQERVKSAMRCDFSWSRSAAEYINLYQKLIGIVN